MQTVLISLLLAGTACGGAVSSGTAATESPSPTAMTTPRAADDLVILVDGHFFMATNWGYRWDFTVRKVLAGRLVDPAFSMTTLPDYAGQRYAGRFQLRDKEQLGVKLRLRRDKDQPGLVGFVAQDGTAWRVVGVDEP